MKYLHVTVSTGCARSLVDLRSISLANADCAFMGDAMGPEPVNEELSKAFVRC
jgi:hypothetical protein